MIFQLLHPWPINGGALTVPAGTILDTEGDWTYLGTALPSPMKLPLYTMALDDAAIVHLRLIHPMHHHLLRKA
jgi:hypothetical protein